MATGVLSSGAAAATTPGSQTVTPTSGYVPRPTQPSPTGPTTPPLSSYTPPAITPTLGTAATAAASPVANAPTASASTVRPIAGITGGQINPNDATNAVSQLNAAVNSGSPYIQGAQQAGLLTAASRGLENSSIGAGAAENAAVMAAAPLAEQNAATATGALMQNSQLQTQASEFNASQQNANQQMNAQLATQTNQFNAGNQTQVSQANAAMKTQADEMLQSIQATLANTGLQGLNAEELATIQGNVSLGIEGRQSINSQLTAFQSGINAILSNPNIGKQQAIDAITTLQNNLINGLKVTNLVQGGTPTSDPWGAGTNYTTTPTAPTPASPGSTTSPGTRPGMRPGTVAPRPPAATTVSRGGLVMPRVTTTKGTGT